MLKSHYLITCAGIFIVCWLVLGVRGLDAGIVGVITFLAGTRVGHKEQAVAEFIDQTKAKVMSWFN